MVQGSRKIAFFIVIAILAASNFAQASVSRFQASVDKATAPVGDPIIYSIEIISPTGMIDDAPIWPDFGKLNVLQGPYIRQSTEIVNSRTTFAKTFTYIVTAREPGVFVIGPARLNTNGQALQTQPIHLNFSVPSDAKADNPLPESLRNEPILDPITNDRSVTQQLRGRIFVRPYISKTDPYVSESILLTYVFYYQERFTPYQLQMRLPEFKEMVSEVVFQADKLQISRELIDGIPYNKAILYQVILTPTKAGPTNVDGYKVHFMLPRDTRRPQRPSDIFTFEPIFANASEVDVPAAPISLGVQALPKQIQPANFSGTVGTFSLDSAVDQESATEDDLVTLTVTLEGRGNSNLAALPVLPLSPDFEVYDHSIETDGWTDKHYLKSKKVIEYLLRPKRSGSLSVPGLKYVIFDPESKSYRELTTPPKIVRIDPGSEKRVDSEGGGAPPDVGNRLRHIHPLTQPETGRARILFENPIVWVVQIAAIAFAVVMLTRATLRSRKAPSEIRRENAWHSFERKLKSLQVDKKNLSESAMALDRAIRELVADRHDLSPEGLTAEEIQKILVQDGFDEEKARRIRRIAELSSQIHYAPLTAADREIHELAREAASILEVSYKS